MKPDDIRKEEIRKRVDRLSELLEGANSVPEVLTAHYRDALKRIREIERARAMNDEVIENLVQERTRLAQEAAAQAEQGRKAQLLSQLREKDEEIQTLREFAVTSGNQVRENLERQIQTKEREIESLRDSVSRSVDGELHREILDTLKRNFDSLTGIIKETTLTPERLKRMAAEAKLGIDPAFGGRIAPDSPGGEMLAGISESIEQMKRSLSADEPPRATPEELGSGRSFTETDEDGDHVYTVIERIENSKVDIHSKFYGGVQPWSPGMTLNASDVGAQMPPEKKEKAKEPDPEPEPEPEPEPGEEKVPEPEPEPEDDELFNPYDAASEDDLFEDPKKPAPPKPKKPEKKPEPKVEPEIKPREDKIKIQLSQDDYEQYGKHLKLTYLFDNMPNNLSYSKYKQPLRNACRITLLGNLEEGLNLFNELKKQSLPPEYKEMIDKNIRDVKYYLRGRFRSSEADLD